MAIVLTDLELEEGEQLIAVIVRLSDGKRYYLQGTNETSVEELATAMRSIGRGFEP